MRELSDWYLTPQHRISSFGGKSLLSNYFNSSLIRALLSVYSSHSWQVWKFKRTPRFSWTKKHLFSFFSSLWKDLKMKELEEWYKISMGVIKRLGASSVLKKMKDVRTSLSTIYPHHSWQAPLFTKRNKRACQRMIYLNTKALFPGLEVKEDHKHDRLLCEETMTHFQIDVYLPQVELALEYNGIQHYENTQPFVQSSLSHFCDEAKKRSCSVLGITLLEIPFWKRGEQVFLEKIVQTRPDMAYFTTNGVNLLTNV